MLQLALDFLDRNRALAVARECAPYVDILEAGTVLIKNVGLAIVKQLAQCQRPVLADLKTADSGELEALAAARAGAAYVTVLAVAADRTIRDFVRAAHEQGVQVVADLLRAPLPRVKFLQRVGVDYLGVHVGWDEQKNRAAVVRLLGRLKGRTKVPLAVAGGITLSQLPQVAPHAGIVVVGGAITRARNPADMARQFQHALRTLRTQGAPSAAER